VENKAIIIRKVKYGNKKEDVFFIYLTNEAKEHLENEWNSHWEWKVFTDPTELLKIGENDHYLVLFLNATGVFQNSPNIYKTAKKLKELALTKSRLIHNFMLDIKTDLIQEYKISTI
jgi:hypothetical protein